MNCVGLEQIEEFAAERLDPDRAGAIATHLAACASCSRLLVEVRGNMRLAERVAQQTPPVSEETPTVAAAPTRTNPGAPLPAAGFPGYTILRELSRGGQGVVYQAVQQSTKRKVAIKVLRDGHFADAAERARFEREVQILGQLKHPNVVCIYDSGSIAGNAYYVMDYVSGKPLGEHVSDGNLDVRQTLAVFAKVCQAVHAAHLKGIIHRDLKPSNIRVDGDGEPRVLDFGLAKISGAAELTQSPAMTMTGQFMGSLPWASPEQAEGQPSKIDIRTDVYSLGVVLYQLLTGRFPYDVSGNVRDALEQIATAQPERPLRRAGESADAIDDEAETIVLKCLSKERDRRYQSAGELARDIDRYLAGEPIEAKRDSAMYLLRKTLKRYRAAVVLGAGFAILLVVGTITFAILWRQSDEARRRAEQAEFAKEAERRDAIAARTEADEQRQRADDAAALARSERDDFSEIADCLTVLLRNSGSFADSRARFEDALQNAKRKHGEMNGHVGTCMHNLAALLRCEGDLRGAERVFRDALRVREASQSAREQTNVAQTSSALAWVLYELGDYAEAARLFEKTLGIIEASPRRESNLLSVRAKYGRTLVKLARFADARKLLDETHARWRRLPAAPNTLPAQIFQGMIELYSTWDSAEPQHGHDRSVQTWQRRYDEWRATTQPASRPSSYPTTTQKRRNEP
ncbi:MAG: protein kinase domain-containing protein [Phycisphaerae bacterium]